MKDIYKDNNIYFRFRENVGQVTEIEVEHSDNTGSSSVSATYTYAIVPYTYNGDGLPLSITIPDCPGITELSNLVYITLNWPRVPGADGYKIYGREDDYLGFLVKVEQPLEEELTVSFTDDGSYVPQISSPVKDETDPDISGRTDWDSLLFVPGRNVQTAELNDIQLISDSYLKNLGDTIFEEGNIIEGCEANQDEEYEDEELTRYIVNSGKMYILGKVRYIPGGTVDIPKYGDSIIGVVATEEVVTADNDSCLKDPSYLEPNYGKEGAVARYYSFEWVVDLDEEMVNVYEMMDGSLVRTINIVDGSPQYGKISKILAQRTYEESGNYVARPFILRAEEGTEEDEFGIRSDSGAIAYLLGNRVEFKDKYLIPFRKGRDTQSINGESKTYRTDTYLYSINSSFVKEVSDFVVQLDKSENITKGLENRTDKLGEKTVSQVTDVYWTPPASATIHYVENVDYRIDGDFIDWNVPGSILPEPFTGQTYQIEYVYTKTLTSGVRVKTEISDETCTMPATGFDDPLSKKDIISVTTISSALSGGGTVWQEGIHFEVDNGQRDAYYQLGQIQWKNVAGIPSPTDTYYVTYYYWNWTTEGDYTSADSYDTYADIVTYGTKNLRDYIDFRNTSVYKPKVDTIFIFDYLYYLGRIDRLVLSENTFDFDIKEGAPSENPVTPLKPSTGMSVARIIVPPYTYVPNDVRIIEESVPTYTMEKISNMDKRLSNVEYFILLDRLEQNALSYEMDYLKKGIFTDAFVGHEKVDFGYEANDPDLRAYVGINKIDQFACLPFTITDYPHTISSASSALLTAQENKSSFTLKYTNEILIAQIKATNSMTVQPFEVLNKTGTLKLLPTMDTWIDTNQVPELKVNFEGTDQVFENYQTLTESMSTVHDSWRTLDAGVEKNEKAGVLETAVGQATEALQYTGLNDPAVNIPIDAIRDNSDIKYSVDKVTTTQQFGNRVVDFSVVKTVRPIPVLFYADDLVPGIVHNIHFDGELVNVYPITSVVGTDVDNPLPNDASYTAYLAKFENLKLKIQSAHVAGITFSNDTFGVVPNDAGKVAGFFMVPANRFNTGLHRIQIKSGFGGLNSSEAESSFLTQGTRQVKQDVSATMTLPKLNMSKQTHSTIMEAQTPVNPPPPALKKYYESVFAEEVNCSRCAGLVNSVNSLSILETNHMIPWYNRMRAVVLSSKKAMVEERWLFGYSLTERPNRYRIFFPDPSNIQLTLDELKDFFQMEEDCIGGALSPAAADKNYWLSTIYIQRIRGMMCVSWNSSYDLIFGCYRVLQDFKILDQITSSAYNSTCLKARDYCLLPDESTSKADISDNILSPWYYNNYTRTNTTKLSTYTNTIEKILFANDISIEADAWMMLFPDPSNQAKLLTLLAGKYKPGSQLCGIDGEGGWICERYYKWVLRSLRLTSETDYNRHMNCWLTKNLYRLKEVYTDDADFESNCWVYDLEPPTSPKKINLTCVATPSFVTPLLCKLDLTRFDIEQKAYVPTFSETVFIKSEEELMKHIDNFIYDLYSSGLFCHFERYTMDYIGNMQDIQDKMWRNGDTGWLTKWATASTTYPIWNNHFPSEFSRLKLAWFPDPDNINTEKIWTGNQANRYGGSSFCRRFVMNPDTRVLNADYIQLRIAFLYGHKNHNVKHYLAQTQNFEDRYNKLIACWAKHKNMIISNLTKVPHHPLSYDPLAQSFFITDSDEGQYISAIGIYFADVGDSAVTVSVRKLVAGYPTGDILGEKTVNGNDIISSEDSSVETLFEFDDPFWVDPGAELAFTVYSTDPRYKIYYCKLGEVDINTETVILKQADIGTMFVSPNLSSWEMRGFSDITFNIYKASFDTSDATIVFDNVPVSAGYSLFSFDTPIFTPVGTSVKASYSYDSGITWNQMSVNENIDFQTFSKTDLKVKLELTGTANISPLISSDKASSKIIKYTSAGRYVSKTMQTIDDYENIRIIFKGSDSAVTSFTAFYSVDNGSNWTEIINPTKTYVDGTYYEYEFLETSITPIDSFKFRLEMLTTDVAVTPKMKDLRVLLY